MPDMEILDALTSFHELNLLDLLDEDNLLDRLPACSTDPATSSIGCSRPGTPTRSSRSGATSGRRWCGRPSAVLRGWSAAIRGSCSRS
jgi:hypothetical protein